MGKKEGSADYIKWFSDIGKDDVKIAGGKGANLGEISKLDVPVPPGFIITTDAYSYFIKTSGLHDKIKELLEKINYENTKNLDDITRQVRELILKSEIPKNLREDITDAYENLGVDLNSLSAREIIGKKIEPEFVAVRSSATAEDLENASFAGQQDSFLNVKGNEKLILAIKKCIASLFTSRAVYYRNKQKFDYEDTKLAVVVQKMIDSDKSGVVFSTDPSYEENHVIIEAVYGLGEGIVSGKVTPDRYFVSRDDFKIISVKVSDKKVAITRNSAGEGIEVKLTKERASAQVLKESEIKKLAEIAIKLEEHYGKPQDIEFAIENSEIYIVQTRAITTMKTRIEKKNLDIKGEVILAGIAASPGVASGKIRIVKTQADLDKIGKGDVLVTKMTNPDMVVAMQRASAIVTDEGGLTAHAAIVSREMGIPSVVGTETATQKLKEDEIITVDGYEGKIYKGKVAESEKKEIKKVDTKTKTKIKVIVDLPSFAERASRTGIREIGLLRIEGIIAESGKHPMFFLNSNKIKDYEEVVFRGLDGIAKYFDVLWVRTSDIRSDEFGNLEGSPKEKEENPMLGMHGIRFSLKYPEILKAELRAMKRISDNGKKIGILMPQIISVDEVRKTKEIAEALGFGSAKIGVMIETPAAVQIIKDLCDEGIDFISFGTNDLTQYTLAIDRGNSEVQDLYDETNPAVLHMIEYVIRIAKRKGVETSICGQAGSKKAMVKFLIKNHIDSISVNADVAAEIADYIAEIESGKIPEEEKPEENKMDFPIKLDESELVDPRELQTSEDTEEEEIQEEEKKEPEKTDGLDIY